MPGGWDDDGCGLEGGGVATVAASAQNTLMRLSGMSQDDDATAIRPWSRAGGAAGTAGPDRKPDRKGVARLAAAADADPNPLANRQGLRRVRSLPGRIDHDKILAATERAAGLLPPPSRLLPSRSESGMPRLARHHHNNRSRRRRSGDRQAGRMLAPLKLTMAQAPWGMADNHRDKFNTRYTRYLDGYAARRRRVRVQRHGAFESTFKWKAPVVSVQTIPPQPRPPTVRLPFLSSSVDLVRQPAPMRVATPPAVAEPDAAFTALNAGYDQGVAVSAALAEEAALSQHLTAEERHARRRHRRMAERRARRKQRHASRGREKERDRGHKTFDDVEQRRRRTPGRQGKLLELERRKMTKLACKVISEAIGGPGLKATTASGIVLPPSIVRRSAAASVEDRRRRRLQRRTKKVLKKAHHTHAGVNALEVQRVFERTHPADRVEPQPALFAIANREALQSGGYTGTDIAGDTAMRGRMQFKPPTFFDSRIDYPPAAEFV